MKPIIIAVGYNRPSSLNRLLLSLDEGTYDGNDIDLYISIDYENKQSDEHKAVLILAEEFKWKYGNKQIIYHSKNLGLRHHMLECFKLIVKEGAGILLEDDITVSPQFYRYTCKALEFYKEDYNISGVSLFNHEIVPFLGVPFYKNGEAFDNYFLQFASSWGQAWTANQLSSFVKWYEKGVEIMQIDNMPKQVKGWPETSWLKYYCKYLVENGLYFVFPFRSLSSNNGDVGTNAKTKKYIHQVNLDYFTTEWRFSRLEESKNVFDSFFEINADILKKMNSELQNEEFAVDLFNNREIELIDQPKVLAISNSNTSNVSFGLERKPIYANIYSNVEGNDIHLTDKENYCPMHKTKILLKHYDYFKNTLCSKKHYFKYFCKLFLQHMLKD